MEWPSARNCFNHLPITFCSRCFHVPVLLKNCGICNISVQPTPYVTGVFKEIKWCDVIQSWLWLASWCSFRYLWIIFFPATFVCGKQQIQSQKNIRGAFSWKMARVHTCRHYCIQLNNILGVVSVSKEWYCAVNTCATRQLSIDSWLFIYKCILYIVNGPLGRQWVQRPSLEGLRCGRVAQVLVM